MPRSFNEEETAKIRTALMKKGKTLFTRAGLRKTTVDDLVREAGIAKGSFYKFFPSKEYLYMEILEAEERELKERLTEQFQEGKDPGSEDLKRFFTGFIDYMEEEPLFLKMFGENALEQLLLKLPAEKLEEHMRGDEDWSRALLASLQGSGFLPQMKTDVFAALMRGIFILFTQKGVIGESSFRESLDFLLDALAEKIVRTGEES